MKPGYVYDIVSEPIEDANTTFYDAGPLTIGIEPRHITVESIRESLRNDPLSLAAFEKRVASGQATTVNDGGLSIHVIDAANGHEYLRFDCFSSDPHYHYNHRTAQNAAAHNRWIRFDDAANGPMLPWAGRALATRLREMLADADAGELADRVDQAEVNEVLGSIPELATVAAVAQN